MISNKFTMISIIIAAYNIEEYIERCLNSIMNQTNSNYEVIIVNDGSTDKTKQLISEFIKNKTNFKLINQKNKGLIEARKTGLRYATGQYIYFLDGDDWIEKNLVEEVIEEAKYNFDLLLFNSNKCYENNKSEFFPLYKKTGKLTLEGVLIEDVLPAIWGKIIKKKYIEDNEIVFMQGVTYGEDLAITTELFMHDPIVKATTKQLHNYFVRKESVTNTVSEKAYDVYKVIHYVEKIVTGKYNEKYDEQIEKLYVNKLYVIYRTSVINKRIRLNIIKQFKQKKIEYNKDKLLDEKYCFAKKITTAGTKKEAMIANKIIIGKKIKSVICTTMKKVKGE